MKLNLSFKYVGNNAYQDDLAIIVQLIGMLTKIFDAKYHITWDSTDPNVQRLRSSKNMSSPEEEVQLNESSKKTQKKFDREIYLKSVAKRSKRFFYILVRIGKPRFYTQIPRYLLTTTGKLQKTSWPSWGLASWWGRGSMAKFLRIIKEIEILYFTCWVRITKEVLYG